MVKPRVSIIIPVFQTPEVLLRRCLDSALGQTVLEIEVVSVDDASPDGCPEILDAYAESDSRVHVIHRKSNGRAGAARNDGLEIAQGDFVLFADADDVLRPDMCRTLVDIAGDRDADIVMCAAEVCSEEGKTINTLCMPEKEYDVSDPLDRWQCIQNLNFALWNKLFRRETIHGLHFEQFEANIGEDTLFNVAALCKSRRVVSAPYVGYEYTVHQSSATGRSAKGMPYLQTLIESQKRIRETLIADHDDACSRKCADWLALKRFCAGCEWIADNPDVGTRRQLWDFWREYLDSDLLPQLRSHRILKLVFSVMSVCCAETAARVLRSSTKLFPHW